MNSKITYYAIPNPTDTSAEAPALPRVFRKPVTLVEPIPAPVPKATLRFYPTAGEAKAGGGEPITATVTVEKSELTENVAHILTPFCEPMYADVYGTVTLEDDATRGEVQMVPKE